MSDEFGPNFITVTDEDGNEIVLEYVDALELDGVTLWPSSPPRTARRRAPRTTVW